MISPLDKTKVTKLWLPPSPLPFEAPMKIVLGMYTFHSRMVTGISRAITGIYAR